MMNEDYFCLFLKTKMGIFLNYGGAGSHHGGAVRITPIWATLVGTNILHILYNG